MKKVLILLFLLFTSIANSQNKKIQKAKLTNFLSKSYFSFNLGGVFYPFSNSNLIDGYATETFTKNPFSGRLLLGYKIKDKFSLQFGTMRPASWFKYDNVNNLGYKNSSVWINIWSLSLKKDFNLTKKTFVYAEAGIANLTRVGFSIKDEVIYEDAHFGNLLYGFGLNHKLNEKWRLSANATFLPESSRFNQPSITQASLGFEYHLQQIDSQNAKRNGNNEYFFPGNILQISYGIGDVGYGANRFFSMNSKLGNYESFGIPVFWLGDVKAHRSFSLTYQRLIFRSKKIFSLDWGLSATYFQSEKGKSDVFAFSIFPVLRFYLMRKKKFDFYTNYSVIGPSYISKSVIDGFETGSNITYQDLMGVGVFFGENRDYNFEMRIMHYSNGNIFTRNAGVAVPIQFTLGKTF